jgi:prepilin-type N-terminal cleavage/methylation domain-containing protein
MRLSGLGERRACFAFTLVEVLLALAISAMLLAAVAAAFNASAVNYRENEDIFKTINNARQALFRMTSQLRTANGVDPYAPGNECTLMTANNEDITYRFNSGDGKLYLITNYDLSDADYVLCENVVAMTCTKNAVLVESSLEVKSVQISITVSSGSRQRTVSAAAVVRKNLS